jgi:methyl-accepting chemotaxis protein
MLVTSAAVILVSSAFIVLEWSAHRDETMNDMMALAGVIGENCTSALKFDDPKDATELLQSLRRKAPVEYACVRKPDGVLLAEYSRDSEVVIVPLSAIDKDEKSFFESEKMLLQRRIYLNDKLVGSISMQVDQSELLMLLRNNLLIILFMILFSGLIAFFLARKLQVIISGPIHALVDTTRKISSDGDYSLRSEKKYNDEVGVLTDSFNEMLDEVELREAKLRERYSY